MAYAVTSSGWGSTTPPNYGLSYDLNQNNLLNSGGAVGVGGVSGSTGGGYNPYQSTYNPNTPGASASSLQAPTTADILRQLQGYVSQGTTNTLANYGAQRGAGGGFGVDNPNSNASVMQALGLTAEGQVEKGITNSFSQQGIDNSLSQYNTTLQNNKDQFAAQLGLDYSKLNEQQKEFVDSQAQQATQFQQKMALDWAALNSHGQGSGRSGGGGSSGGGSQGGGGSSGGGGLGSPYPGGGGTMDPGTTDWWSNPDNFDPSTGTEWDYSGGGGTYDYWSDPGNFDPSTGTEWDLGSYE